jgi:hypothetical protein
VWTAANPAIPHGGAVGESKWDILTRLPAEAVVPGVLLPPGDLENRLSLLDGRAYPLVLKPDVGERGAGVRLARGPAEARQYLAGQPAAVVAQAYHPGPFEAGVYYYRLPGADKGRIFSVTDKVFPEVTGDGRSTLEALIVSHPRYRLQAEVFLARHEAVRGRILDRGEVFRLALAGNHCQGTLFRDGSRLLTPALEDAIDAASRRFEGFFIGRFDIRYRDVERFRAGEDFAVVELNGALAESTNLYDPSWPLWHAYATLFRQWSLLYSIGAANRARGHRVSGAAELLAAVWRHLRRRDDRAAD